MHIFGEITKTFIPTQQRERWLAAMYKKVNLDLGIFIETCVDAFVLRGRTCLSVREKAILDLADHPNDLEKHRKLAMSTFEQGSASTSV
jgi:hypothetical protein